MKIIVLGMAAFLFSINIQAQNKNVKTEVKTNITTIKDSQGEKKLVETKEVEEVQNLQLNDANSNVLNKDIKESPVEVTATTKITADGVTKVIDVDRSAYYELDGTKYQVSTDKKGYSVFMPDGKKSAVLRKTSNNNYIYRAGNKTSFGHFNSDGNMILESYDEATDTITVTTYIIAK
ncbi:MAG TPA: hypothetical protein VIH09_00530 [Flavobacterium sp.]|uniref:hypothetical protein n=1 Tax=Flavobacterium sp. TaxID=239 RepID=UPI002F42D32D